MNKRGIPGFEGEIVWPDDSGYEDQRRVWNAMHDRRPALIAHVEDAGALGEGLDGEPLS